MPKDKQEAYINETKGIVRDFLKSEGITQAGLGRAIGKSNGSVIGPFLRGEYKGRNLELARDLKLYIQDFMNKRLKKIENIESIFESKDKKIAQLVIEVAVEDREMGLIYGAPGTGKSIIAKEYAKSHPNAILIEATLHTTAKTLLGILCEKLRIEKSKSLDECVRAIAKEFAKRDAVLLIDEGEHLPLRALEDLRRIHDFSQIPIVLIGTHILMRNLLGKNGELAQLSSRIGSKWEMEGLSDEECSLAFSNKHIFGFSRGNFRKSIKLKRRIEKLASYGCDMRDKETVLEAAKMMFL
ncbi:hypothetical protein BKH44_06255 [Helicobacter sp. 13S00477-4]|nr:hypothetical protein BKH44_06255 [Helicobacter sp. 13S00477-4]